MHDNEHPATFDDTDGNPTQLIVYYPVFLNQDVVVKKHRQGFLKADAVL